MTRSASGGQSESKTLTAESKKPLKSRAQLIGRSQQSFTSSQNSPSARQIVIPASMQKVDSSLNDGHFRCKRPRHFEKNCCAPIPSTTMSKTYIWGAGMVRWRERSPPANVSWVRFPDPFIVCGLSFLLVLYSALRGFSLSTRVFPSPQKPTFLNSNSILDAWTFLNEFL